MTVKEISEALRAEREAQKMSRKQLENMCGVHHTTIGAIETNTHASRLDTYVILLDALGLKLEVMKK